MKKVLYILLLLSSPLVSMQEGGVEERTELDLSWRGMTIVPSGLECLSELQTLDLSHNQFTELSVLPPSLTKLDVTDNQFSVFPTGLPITLQTLLIGLNYLEALPSDLANLLPNLIQFNVAGNKICKLPLLPETLEYLGASQNRISILPEEWPKKLTRLELCYNNLSTLGTALPLMEKQETVIFAEGNPNLPEKEALQAAQSIKKENERRIAKARATPAPKKVMSLLNSFKNKK